MNIYLFIYFSSWKGINRNHGKQTWHMLHDKLSIFKHASRGTVWKAHTGRHMYHSRLWGWEHYNPASLIFEGWKEGASSTCLEAAHFKGTVHIQVTYYNHYEEKGKKSDLTFQRHCHLNLEQVLVYLKRLFPESKTTANYVCQALYKFKLKDVFPLSLIWRQTLSLCDVSLIRDYF